MNLTSSRNPSQDALLLLNDFRKMMKTLSGGFMGKKLGKMKLPPGFPFGDMPGR